jgi:hypothetical protein
MHTPKYILVMYVQCAPIEESICYIKKSYYKIACLWFLQFNALIYYIIKSHKLYACCEEKDTKIFFLKF